MDLFLLTLNYTNTYDTYTSLIVAASDVAAAINTRVVSHVHNGVTYWDDEAWPTGSGAIVATLIGTATPEIQAGVIHSDFRAG